MGNRKSFEANFEVEGQGPDVLITLDHLGLTTAEAGKFWRAFCRIDRHKTGIIDRSELYRYYKMKESPFLNFIFASLSNHSSKLNFEEFVILMWDFLSQEISLYCFLRFDTKKKNKLSFEVLHQMVSMIHGSDFNSEVENIVRSIDAGIGEFISSSDFAAYTQENRCLLRPIRRTQSYLRVQIIGEVYWKSMMDIRRMKLPGKTVLEILSRREDEIDTNQVKITL